MTSSAWILLSRWSRLLCFLQRLPQAEHCDIVGDLGQGRRQPREFSWDKNDSLPTARSLAAQAPPSPPIIPTPTEELLFPLVQVATEIQNRSTQRLGEHPGAGQRLGPQPWAAKTQMCIRDGRGQAPQNTSAAERGAGCAENSQDEWDCTRDTGFPPGYVPTSAQLPPRPCQQPFLGSRFLVSGGSSFSSKTGSAS